ncbi:MAG: helix-hairpin-helix domain-containing protein [Cyclobacteriaceae bacterium]|nr:helix-hairpin-helix domain-containing protein [Cyclobacteriaceae bacterium]
MKYLLISLMLSIACVHAQEPVRREPDLQRLTDELIGFQDEDLNYEELYENLVMLMAQPLNINTATAEQLRFLNLMTEHQVQELLRYRDENGPLLSMYELQAVPGFDRPTLDRILPFFTIESTGSARPLLRKIMQKGNGYMLLRYSQTLQDKAGFTSEVSEDQRFRGNAQALYFRFRSAVTGNYSAGITLEKDAGEEMVWNPAKRQYRFDFVSPHLQLMNRGRIKNLIIGNYQAQVGQGLLLGGNFGFGKGGETVTTVRRSNLGFLPYTSLNETGYLNGVAATLAVTKNIYASPYYSRTWRDASVVSDSTEQSFITSFPATGLHRNNSELARRKQVSEEQYGVVLQYQHRQLDGGLIFSSTSFTSAIRPAAQPYNQFWFSGDVLTNAGFYLNYTFKNFTFFSEAAQSLRFGHAWIAGLMGSLTPRLDMAWVLRNYQPDFHSFYANALAESTRPQNEQGIYYGWKYRISRSVTYAGYVDFFRFPWLRYRVYAPSEGHEWLMRLTWQPARNTRLTVQFREESKARNISPAEGNIHQIATGVRHNTWLIAEYAAAKNLRMRTRAQFSSYRLNHSLTQGMIVLQDIIYERGRFSLTGRYALFDTDDYDNRQYVYENDVWLAFSFPAWSDTGIRSYLMIEYDISRSLTVWLRFAHTSYINRTSIGSGPDRIEGPVRNDVRLQLRWKL